MIDPDPTLTPLQKARVAQLTDAEVREIDRTIETVVSDEWKKIAYVVGMAMMSISSRIEGVPDLYYAARLRVMIDAKRLIARGDPTYMHNCEVRSPNPK